MITSSCVTCDTQYNKAYQRDIIRRLTSHFSRNPCVDCGETEATLLTFWGGSHIWTMIGDAEAPTEIRRRWRDLPVVCVTCERRRITERVGPWGIPKE